ncbi:MAG: argininosuccinate lyase [Spirochaetes bacterium]|nr:argininosuccinate lyase [Spirochaetota bacterium]
MAKLWELASDSLNPLVEHFLSSLSVDSRLLEEELAASLAHCHMLGSCGIINPEDAAAISAVLQTMQQEYQAGRLKVDAAAEDVHSYVEQELVRRCGSAGESIHAGRSRNDQVATDLRLYLQKQFRLAEDGIMHCVKTITELAGGHVHTLMPGFTHLRKAQPISLAFHLCAWCAALERDYSRFLEARRRADECPLGSAALAGTGLPIDREQTAAELGFARPSRNAMDATADRDACVDYAAAAASLMMHLSRFCEEIILWTSEAWNFAAIAADCRTGSSIMPQKQNPDLAELIRGKSSIAIGALTSLLVLQKGVALGYARDLQEDKAIIFNLTDTVNSSLEAFSLLAAALQPHPQQMQAQLDSGYLEATDLAELLVLRGIPFRQAYRIAKQTVLKAQAGQSKIAGLGPAELASIDPSYARLGIDQSLLQCWLTAAACLNRRSHIGGTAADTVQKEIQRLQAWCASESSPTRAATSLTEEQ